MTKANQELLGFKMRRMTEGVSLKLTDLKPLIDKAWKASFARKAKNQQAIADRGWYPLNYNLLPHPDIRATMTRVEKESEVLSDNDIFLPEYQLNPKQQSSDSTLNDAITTTTVTDISLMLSLNFSTGMSVICLTDILRHEQLHEARKRIQMRKGMVKMQQLTLKLQRNSLPACVGSMESIGLVKVFLR